MPPLFPLTLAFYAVACTLYFVAVAQSQPAPRLQQAARLVLVLGFVSQFLDIGWLCIHGQSPSTATKEAVYFASWLIIGVYLLATVKSALPVIATLILPVAMILDLAARLAPHEIARASSVLLSVHILCATLGTATFAVAAGASVIYLMTEKQLKRHNLGQLGRAGPALQTLDTLNRRCILVAFPAFTLALITGAIFAVRLVRMEGISPLDLLVRPQYALSIITWLIYAVLLLFRVIAGMRGRRAALLTLYGFATALSVLLLYFLRGLKEAM